MGCFASVTDSLLPTFRDILSVLSVMGHAFQEGCRSRHVGDYIVAMGSVFGSHGRCDGKQ
jgi:hypothetical protein